LIRFILNDAVTTLRLARRSKGKKNNMSLNVAHKVATVAPAAPFAVVGTPAQSRPSNLLEHLDTMRDAATSLTYARNVSIFQEGDRAHHIYRIVSGTIRLCRHTPDGRRHIAEFALPGDLLGVFNGTEQGFTAEAVTDVVVIAYPRALFDRASEREPRFRAAILSHLSAHLATAQLHTFVLGCQSAKERLASFIVRHAARTGGTDSGRVDLAMGRQDIADHLGLTIETICRAVTTLKNGGLIGVPNTHQIVLRNRDALCDLAEGGTAH
jgi:CRP/FNR family nitrogen fixation transcriptional regulator